MSHRAASSGLSGEENLIQSGTFAVRWHHFSFHPLIWQHLIPAGPPRAIVNLLLAPTHVKWPFVSHMDKTEQRRGNNNVVSNIYIQNISNIYWSEDNIDALSLYKSDLMEEWPIPVYYRLPALFFFSLINFDTTATSGFLCMGWRRHNKNNQKTTQTKYMAATGVCHICHIRWLSSIEKNLALLTRTNQITIYFWLSSAAYSCALFGSAHGLSS